MGNRVFVIVQVIHDHFTGLLKVTWDHDGGRVGSNLLLRGIRGSNIVGLDYHGRIVEIKFSLLGFVMEVH